MPVSVCVCTVGEKLRKTSILFFHGGPQIMPKTEKPRNGDNKCMRMRDMGKKMKYSGEEQCSRTRAKSCCSFISGHVKPLNF